jgi:hypothetical protein
MSGYGKAKGSRHIGGSTGYAPGGDAPIVPEKKPLKLWLSAPVNHGTWAEIWIDGPMTAACITTLRDYLAIFERYWIEDEARALGGVESSDEGEADAR